jgi:hypothetical protein
MSLLRSFKSLAYTAWTIHVVVGSSLRACVMISGWA